MNKVYLSGEVFDQPRLVNKPDGEAHLVFSLMVKHRSKAGVRRELYRISAWGNCATYCSAALRQGMRIALQGYLTLRPLQFGDKLFHAVEVTMNEVYAPTMDPQLDKSANEAEPISIDEAVQTQI